MNMASKERIPKTEWQKKLNDVKISEADLNKLVMDFLLVTKGCSDAAEKFRFESGTEQIDESLHPLREAVESGNIIAAIARINDLDPKILQDNPLVLFHLQQQMLIEIIRDGKVDEALNFAEKELAPKGEENPSVLEELEKTLVLLAFEDPALSPVGELMSMSQCQKTAREVTATILASQNREPKLSILLKMLIWAQDQLSEIAKYPCVGLQVLTEVLEKRYLVRNSTGTRML